MQNYPINANLGLIDEPSVVTYLETVFAGVDWTPERFICVRGIGEKGTPQEAEFRENWFVCPHQTGNPMPLIMERIQRYAKYHVAAFVVPAVLNAAVGGADNVELFSTVLADFDGGDTDAKLAWVCANIGTPTMIVASGGVTEAGTLKRHVYFQLTEPTADIRGVVMLRDAFARKCGADVAMGMGVESNPVGRAHQPIRIAGSVHAKNGEARPVTIESKGGPVWSFSALEMAVAVAAASPWALPEKIMTPELLPVGGGMFKPEKQSESSRALTTDVFEGGTEQTRWTEFSRVAGHHIHCARRGEYTPEEARELTFGWVSTHMIPAWPRERVAREFDGLLSLDMTRNGAFAPMPTPVIEPGKEKLGIYAWDAAAWATDPSPKHVFLAEELLIVGEPHLCVAEGGSGKTGLMLDLALKVSSFQPGDVQSWCGAKIVSGGPVALILCEDSRNEIHIRLRQIDRDGMIEKSRGKCIVMPMASLGGAFPMSQKDAKTGEAKSGQKWNEIVGLLNGMKPKPVLVIIDTLNSVSHGDENSAVVIGEMMKEAQRVCGELGAALVFNHHVRKSNDPINSLDALKGAVRGSSAITSFFRVCFGMFAAGDYRRRMKAMGLTPVKGALWRFGVVKANINGLMRGEKTLLRNGIGILEDATKADKYNEVNYIERLAWLMVAIERAAVAGHPYTAGGKGSSTGLYRRRTELPPILRAASVGEFAGLVEEAMQSSRLTLCAVKGSAAKAYLDLPDGPLAVNEAGEELSKGAYDPPKWAEYYFDLANETVSKGAAGGLQAALT